MATTSTKKPTKKKPVTAKAAPKPAKATAAAPKAKAAPSRYAALRAWNLRFAALLFVQAVVIIVLSTSATVPMSLQYLAIDTLASEASGHEVLAVASRHVLDVPLAWLVAKFLLVFALTFLLVGTVLRTQYEKWLDRGVNKARWIGYGLGTGAMAFTVATLSGISDIGYLVLLFGSLAVLGALATITELIGGGRKLRKFTIITALVTAALPVLAIASTFVGVLTYGGNLPIFMYYIYGSMLLAAVAFSFACILRLRQRGRWADTVYAERMFMLLGFLASSVLAWQIFAGALQA